MREETAPLDAALAVNRDIHELKPGLREDDRRPELRPLTRGHVDRPLRVECDAVRPCVRDATRRERERRRVRDIGCVAQHAADERLASRIDVRRQIG